MSIGFPRQEYWNGLLFPFPSDLSDPEIEPVSPALRVDFFTAEPPGKSVRSCNTQSVLLALTSQYLIEIMRGLPV